MIIAVAGAIAINEIVIGLLHSSPPPQGEAEAKTTRIVMETAPPTPRPTPPPTPRPTPRPTPTPRPATPIPHATIAPVAQHAAQAAVLRPHAHHGGAPARKAAVHALVGRAANAHGSHGAGVGIAGTGSGTGVGAGNAAGGAGGNGAGSGGNGSGAANSDAPCDDWQIVPVQPARYDRGTNTMHERIKIMVATLAGDQRSDVFPYDFIYPSDAADPFSLRYLGMPDGDPRVPEPRIQFPPAGFDRASLSPLLRAVLARTLPDGLTSLPECPARAGAPR